MTTIHETTTTRSAPELVGILREAIINGTLVPNQRLVEADVAHEHRASRGNVRAALFELSVEGLVERIPNRGARVRAVSVGEAVAIAEVRATLEALCARRAAARTSDADSKDLKDLGRRMEHAVSRGDGESYSAYDQQLHAKIIAMSAHQTAATTIQRFHGPAGRFQFQSARQPGQLTTSLLQNLAIIEAICCHDQEGAAEAMRLHLEIVAGTVRDLKV